MIVVSYFDGTKRRGMLAWAHRPDGTLQAMGGFDPGREPTNGEGLTTVVTFPDQNGHDNDNIYSGWPHPDNIPEVSG